MKHINMKHINMKHARQKSERFSRARLVAAAAGPLIALFLYKLCAETLDHPQGKSLGRGPFACSAIFPRLLDVGVPEKFSSTPSNRGGNATKEDLIAERDGLVEFIISHQRDRLSALTRTGGRLMNYLCDRNAFCGGLGDRLRGMYTTVFHAILTGAAFHVSDTKPFDDTLFFDRSSIYVDDTSDLLKCRPMARVASWQNMDVPDDHNLHVNFTKEWSNFDVIDVRSNQLPYSSVFGNVEFSHVLRNIGLHGVPFEISMSAVIHIIYGRPSPWMGQKISHLESAIDSVCGMQSYKVGVQLRTAGQKKRFSDGTEYSKEGFGSFEHRIKNFARQATDRCRTHNSDSCCIFLTADDEEAFRLLSNAVDPRGAYSQAVAHVDIFRSVAGNVSIVYNSGSTAPIHLDRSTGEGPGFFEEATKTYLEWYVLAHYMDFLVVSYSGFGESAALANLTDFVVETRVGFVPAPVRYLGMTY
jgi:hypothetical protein